jgi:hypothetical protein
MQVALMMEGKFSGEELQALDADEDLMSTMARELVEKPRPEWGTGRTISPFYATWLSTLCKKRDRKAPCAASSNAPVGMMATSTGFSSYFEMRLPWRFPRLTCVTSEPRIGGKPFEGGSTPPCAILPRHKWRGLTR